MSAILPNQQSTSQSSQIREQTHNSSQELATQKLLTIAIIPELSDQELIIEIDTLLRQGANINARNEKGITIILEAVSRERIEIYRFLLKNGADPTIASDTGLTPLHVAACVDLEICKVVYEDTKQLLESRMNDSVSLEFKRTTPLHLAIIHDKADVVSFLISKGADINSITYAGFTPLMLAVDHLFQEIAEKLQDAGANLNAVLQIGTSLLTRVASYDKPGSLRLLLALDKRAEKMELDRLNINAKDSYGYTALHRAVIFKRYNNLLLLLEANADAQTFNDLLETPSMLALRDYSLDELSNPVIEALRALDGGVTQLTLNMRLCGARFSLPDPAFSKLRITIALPHFLDSIFKYKKKIVDSQNRLILDRTFFLLLESMDRPSDYLIQHIEKGNPVCFPFELPNHVIAMGVDKEYCYLFDKSGLLGPPGISIFKIQNKDSLIPVLKTLLEWKRNCEIYKPSKLEGLIDSNKEFNLNQLFHALDIFKEYWDHMADFAISKPEPTSGNCIIEAIKGAFEIGLILMSLRETQNLESSIAKAKDLFEKWEKADDRYALDLAEQAHKHLLIQKLFGLKNFYLKVFNKCYKDFENIRNRNILVYLNRKDPQLLLSALKNISV